MNLKLLICLTCWFVSDACNQKCKNKNVVSAIKPHSIKLHHLTKEDTEALKEIDLYISEIQANMEKIKLEMQKYGKTDLMIAQKPEGQKLQEKLLSLNKILCQLQEEKYRIETDQPKNIPTKAQLGIFKQIVHRAHL